MLNGIIFQKKEHRNYKGVDGNNWYLEDLLSKKEKEYFNDYVYRSWREENYVDVLYDIKDIKKYYYYSLDMEIDFRIIACDTSAIHPICKLDLLNSSYLGIDYAYSGGSYYSAVNNDLVLRSIREFEQIKLNCNGLLNDIEQLGDYIKIRNECKKNGEYSFEEGDFIVYKLYEINNYQIGKL